MSFKQVLKSVETLADPIVKAKVSRYFKMVLDNMDKVISLQGYQTLYQEVLQNKTRTYSQKNKIHQIRFIGLVILIEKFKNKDLKKPVYQMYLSNLKHINNWDLVDLSAPHIVGQYLYHTQTNRNVLYQLCQSKNLWEKRISILSTMPFVKNNQFDDCLKISKLLLGDKHDLIHKAVGWLLRQVGSKSQPTLEKFLKQNYDDIPRTALRYSIEKFPQKKRKQYLKGDI